MLVNIKRIYMLLAVLLGVAIVSGCQSCQDSSQAPPPSAPKAAVPGAKPPAVDHADHEAAGGAGAEEEEVDEDALVLLAEGEPEDGEAPLSVKLTVESLIEDEMDDPQYKWDFGDGSPISTEASPTHVYEKPGSYTATIRIVDGKGDLGWDEVDIDVEEP